MNLSPAVPSILSNDLILEVLSFLPVRSLIRFRSVSKCWKTLISDPTFVKLHLHKSQSQTRNSLFPIIMQNLKLIPGSYYEWGV
ncbi:F-box and associated interaction domain protein [Medicago truncatula]|uniref:F-box and associated interaction domain protein n=1 Tax=Medicago truncatula TaxID=3880 RepID=G7I8L0_MEDTR|nr:F-box and associated interaction domain protein [Medicago truncatula]